MVNWDWKLNVVYSELNMTNHKPLHIKVDVASSSSLFRRDFVVLHIHDSSGNKTVLVQSILSPSTL